MNNAKIIEALNMTIAGLTAIRDEFEGEPSKVSPKVEKKEDSKVIPIDRPVEKEEVEDKETITGKFSAEDLASMKYNDLKKLGASLGVKCTGTRDQITERILALDIEVEKQEDEAPMEEPETVKEEKETKPAKKKLGKKAKEEDEIGEEFLNLANELAEDMSAEDIKEALADAGVKVRSKKKETLVKELAKALEKGIIEVEDDDEEEEVEEAETENTDTEETEVDASTWYSDLDPKGYNNPDNMTEERAKACLEVAENALEQIKSGETEYDDVVEFINTYATEEEVEAMGEEPNELVVTAMFLELLKRTVDDDGEVHDPSDPYEVTVDDDEPLNMCCGHELKYDKKTKNYICEVCGEEYEAE